MAGKIDEQLSKLLLEGDFVSEEELKEAQSVAQKEKKSLQQALLDGDFINDEHLGQLVANINKWHFVSLKKQGVDENVARLIPEKVAKKQLVLPFAEEDGVVKVAMNNPEDISLIHLLKKTLGGKLVIYYATAQDILSQLSLYKSDIKEEFGRIFNSGMNGVIGGEVKEHATIQIVNMLLSRGYDSGASDIHVEPYDDHTLVRFRVDGVMQDAIAMPKESHDLIISRIKVMSKLRTDEHQVPQDGKLQYELEGEKVDVRVSIVPTTKGENAVMRLLSEKARQFTLEELGLASDDFKKLSEAIRKPWGMILSTGPTGSGKTTSLYAILKILNKKDVNIDTIEDPVEYNIDGITQIQVNPRAQLTFAAGLRSIVRQDPDVIMVGEIRDGETAGIAVNSAMTGHLVLSTLHTNDAATTLPRLLDMGVEPFLVASTVNIAIGQRLIRKICTRCIESYEITAEELSQKIPKSAFDKIMEGKDKVTLYRGKGCELCHGDGYLGRTGVFEVLEMDDDIRKLIMENADADTVRAKAISKGMKTMFDDAKEKVFNGVTTVEEMLRTVKE